MPTAIALPALALLLAGAGLAALQQLAWPFPAGLALAAGAPLFYLLGQRKRGRLLRHHPIAVSAISGLGCVFIMVGSQRFGSDPAWVLPAGLSALLIWTLWQRGQRKRSGPHSDA